MRLNSRSFSVPHVCAFVVAMELMHFAKQPETEVRILISYLDPRSPHFHPGFVKETKIQAA